MAESGGGISDVPGNDQFCSVFVYEDEKHGFIFGSCVGVLFLAGVCNVCISWSVGTVDAVSAAGGIGMGNSFLYMLIDFKFLHLGSQSVWIPYVLVAAALVQIPVFLGAAVHSHCKMRK